MKAQHERGCIQWTAIRTLDLDKINGAGRTQASHQVYFTNAKRALPIKPDRYAGIAYFELFTHLIAQSLFN